MKIIKSKKLDTIERALLLFMPLFLVVQFRPRILVDVNDYFSIPFFSYLNLSWQVLQIISLVCMFVLFIYNFKLDRFSAVYILIIVGLLLSTMINGTSISRLLSLIISPLTILFGLNIARQKNMFKNVVRVIYLYHAILILINFCLVILFPDSLFTDARGMNVMYLFGNYQQNMNWFVGFIASSAVIVKELKSSTKLDKVLFYGTHLAMLLTSIIVWSVTAILSLVVIYVTYYILSNTHKLDKVVNFFNVYIVSIILTIFIGYFEGLKYFSFIIVTIFKKTVTMGSRLDFWKKSIESFLKSPIFGNGFQSSDAATEIIGKTTSHNHYINLLYNGGLVYFILMIILVYIAYKKLKSSSRLVYITVSVSLIGYFIYFLTEARLNQNVFILLLAIAYYYPHQKLMNGVESQGGDTHE